MLLSSVDLAFVSKEYLLLTVSCSVNVIHFRPRLFAINVFELSDRVVLSSFFELSDLAVYSPLI